MLERKQDSLAFTALNRVSLRGQPREDATVPQARRALGRARGPLPGTALQHSALAWITDNVREAIEEFNLARGKLE